MLAQGGAATTGTVQHDGVRYDSNSLDSEQMRSVLEIPAADAPADPPPDLPTDSPTATPDAPISDAPPADASPASAQPKAKKNPQERIDRITYEREEAKREAARERQAREEAERRYGGEFQSLRAELEALKRGAQPKAAPAEDAEPKLEEFADQPDPYAAWMRATARYDARQEWKAAQQQAQAAYQRDQQERQHLEKQHAEHQRLHGWTQRMEAAFAKAPDMRDQIENMAVLPRPMMDVIIDSAIPDQILTHLMHHPEEQARIQGLKPLHQFREMARIEYQLEQAASLVTGSAPPAKPKTTAHPPVSPVSGSHAAPKGGEPGPDASYEEHREYWNKVEAEQRGRRR